MYDGKTIWMLIRGVAGHPSDQHEWEYEARDRIIRKLNVPAIAVSYFTTFLTVWLRRGMRARQCAHILREYAQAEYRINAIAHSEGTVVITDAIRLARWPRIEILHLVCGACNADFQRNGLNFALNTGAIGVVHVWIAGRDTAMKWESLKAGRQLFGLDRGYPLGLHGPQNVDPHIADGRIISHRAQPWSDYGHSTWAEPKNLDNSLNTFLAYS